MMSRAQNVQVTTVIVKITEMSLNGIYFEGDKQASIKASKQAITLALFYFRLWN